MNGPFNAAFAKPFHWISSSANPVKLLFAWHAR